MMQQNVTHGVFLLKKLHQNPVKPLGLSLPGYRTYGDRGTLNNLRSRQLDNMNLRSSIR